MLVKMLKLRKVMYIATAILRIRAADKLRHCKWLGVGFCDHAAQPVNKKEG